MTMAEMGTGMAVEGPERGGEGTVGGAGVERGMFLVFAEARNAACCFFGSILFQGSKYFGSAGFFFPFVGQRFVVKTNKQVDHQIS